MAVVYSDKKDEKSFEQIRQMLDMEQFADAEIRIMPDYHAGAGCVIGFTADHMKYIAPNIIGVDIGCGILAMNLGKEITVEFDKPCALQIDGETVLDVTSYTARAYSYAKV